MSCPHLHPLPKAVVGGTRSTTGLGPTPWPTPPMSPRRRTSSTGWGTTSDRPSGSASENKPPGDFGSIGGTRRVGGVPPVHEPGVFGQGPHGGAGVVFARAPHPLGHCAVSNGPADRTLRS